MGSNTPGHEDRKKQPAGTVATGYGYDNDPDTAGRKFDFDTAFADSLGACAMAVLQAGDCFQISTDKGHHAVHIRIISDQGGFDKWFDTSEAAVYRLDRLYDTAIAKLNAKNPPKLLP